MLGGVILQQGISLHQNAYEGLIHHFILLISMFGIEGITGTGWIFQELIQLGQQNLQLFF